MGSRVVGSFARRAVALVALVLLVGPTAVTAASPPSAAQAQVPAEATGPELGSAIYSPFAARSDDEGGKRPATAPVASASVKTPESPVGWAGFVAMAVLVVCVLARRWIGARRPG